MEPRISIITLGVRDVEKSATFYETVFSRMRSKYSNDGIAFIKLSGIVLALFSYKALAADARVGHSVSDFRGFALAYNARSESEVDEIIKTVEEVGGKTTKKPQKGTWGVYSSYFSDPDGNLVEVAYNPILPMREDGELDI